MQASPLVAGAGLMLGGSGVVGGNRAGAWKSAWWRGHGIRRTAMDGRAPWRVSRDHRDQHSLLIARTAENQNSMVDKPEVGRHDRSRALKKHELHRDHVVHDRERGDIQDASARRLESDPAAAYRLLLLMQHESIGGVFKERSEALADHR